MLAANSTQPRIYVASLSDYNAGRLVGEWFEVQDLDSLREGIQHILSRSCEPKAEEWTIHDYEGFCGYQVSEFEDLEELCEIASAIETHGEEDETDYSECYVDDCGLLDSMPETLRPYFDYEKFGRDMFIDSAFGIRGDDGFHVFYR